MHPNESNELDKMLNMNQILLFTRKYYITFLRENLEFASINLSKNGVIYLEINPNFIKDFNQILTNYSINHINFKDDFRGKKRLVKLIF